VHHGGLTVKFVLLVFNVHLTFAAESPEHLAGLVRTGRQDVLVIAGPLDVVDQPLVRNRVVLDGLVEHILYHDVVFSTVGREDQGSELAEVAELHPVAAAEILVVDHHFVLHVVGLHVVLVPDAFHLQKALEAVLVAVSHLDFLLLLPAELPLQVLPGQSFAFIFHLVVEHAKRFSAPKFVGLVFHLLVD